MNHDLQDLEAALAAVNPAAVPAHLIDRIEAGLAAEPLRAVDPAAKVVPFPVTRRVPANVRRHGFPWAWAAAAVAMAGALAAWFVPGEGPAPVVVSSRQSDQLLPIPATRAVTSTAPRKSKVGGVVDEGVVWDRDGRPLRKVRVLYIDQHVIRDPQGRLVEVGVPRVQYVLLPERVD